MAKKVSQALKCVMKYGVAATLGALASVLCLQNLSVAPEYRTYTVPVSFELATSHGIIDGYTLGARNTAAMAYLYEPLYFLQREKGVNILKKSAAQGFTGAMVSLSGYYVNQMRTQAKGSVGHQKFEKDALYWARKAAQAGNPSMLVEFVLPNSPRLEQADVELLEKFARKHAGVAFALSGYYAGKYDGIARDQEKSKHWLKYYAANHNFLPLPVDRQPVLKEILYPHN